jgi:C1A family cysteine protease
MATARRSSPGTPARKPSSLKLTPRSIRGYGWIPDLPDQRDHMYAAPLEKVGVLPTRVDLRSRCPAVFDQGNLGSCTANAIAAALEFDQMKQSEADVFTPSRLFIYYSERVMEHSVGEDSGAMIRDGIKSVAKLGAPHEALWPYVISKFAMKPAAAAYKDATKHQALLYQRLIQDANQCRGCLADGYPFIFGFSVYESFESAAVARTGRVPMPEPGEKQLGGHAVLCVGYDDPAGMFIVRNSWGSSWGMKGYFTMPMDYLLDSRLAEDLWTVRTVE